ncbi:hypothetical protein [Pararhizobium sp. A13]|uniref:hypothetical protein n=1 Tax=Pararhizobium sp. A13 TaxID=3133975 RepID=UPI00311B2290
MCAWSAAIDLDQCLGKDPILIALAYAIAQQGRVVPLIGPGSVAELEYSLAAFAISPRQRTCVGWRPGANDPSG